MCGDDAASGPVGEWTERLIELALKLRLSSVSGNKININTIMKTARALYSNNSLLLTVNCNPTERASHICL
jgi:hypothetical protein